MGRTVAELKKELSDWCDSVILPGSIDDLRIRINQKLFNLTMTDHGVDVKHGPTGTGIVIIRCHESVIQTVKEIAKDALPLGVLAEVLPQEKEQG